MIRELYVKKVRDRNPADRLDQDIRSEISDLLEEEKRRMGKEDYKELMDKALLIASMAEENGFVEGFRDAFRLWVEILSE